MSSSFPQELLIIYHNANGPYIQHAVFLLMIVLLSISATLLIINLCYSLQESEVSALPEDEKWPFLLRFPISAFGMCLGVSSQAILWKTLATAPSMSFLHVSLTVNFVLWCISLALMSTVSLMYSLKIIFYFETVRREYYHPVRINFFFAPWIACLFYYSTHSLLISRIVCFFASQAKMITFALQK